MNNHLDFCKKYPQTIVGYEDGMNLLQYQIDNDITPIVDYFKVGELVQMYNKHSEVFIDYRTLKEDWNDLISPIIKFIK
jgi:hypothetical protein